jgi:RNA polymerase sigma-70 factor (ECF subfamily)
MTESGPPGPSGTQFDRDDQVLLEATRRGDPEAIDTWYRAEHPQVYRLCFGFLAHAADAEDLAQDAMLKLLDRLDAYDPARSYKAWRNTVVLNLCRDHLRRVGSRRAAEGRGGERSLPRPLPAPEDHANAEELQAILASSLSALSPREREVFVLRDLSGHSTDEVADTMGVTAGTVRSLLSLARRRLRGVLGPRLGATVPGAAS